MHDILWWAFWLAFTVGPFIGLWAVMYGIKRLAEHLDRKGKI